MKVYVMDKVYRVCSYCGKVEELLNGVGSLRCNTCAHNTYMENTYGKVNDIPVVKHSRKKQMIKIFQSLLSEYFKGVKYENGKKV